MADYSKFFIDGAWVAPKGTGTIDVINATTEEVIASVPEGTAEDAAIAVAAAKAAFPGWRATSLDERAKYVQRLSEGLMARAGEIAESVTAEVGTPAPFSQVAQGSLPWLMSATYAEIANSFPFEEQIDNSLVIREGVGVVACITPWNYPLHQVTAKLDRKSVV